MKKAERKLNNEGFSLILVIICMTFIGVLATMIISMSVNNVQMRVIEQESSDNFYSAEEVMDELSANVEKQANIALGEAYTKFLQRYAATAPKARQQLFVTLLTDELKKTYTDDFTALFTNDKDAFLEKYATASKDRSGIVIGGATGVVPEMEAGKGKITIQGLSVTYTGADGYETTIKTDVVVEVTYPQFFEDNAAGPAFLDYAIIADSDIRVPDGTVSGTVQGSVYSGRNLIVEGGASLALQSPYVIVKNMMDIRNKSSLEIGNGGSNIKYASEKNKGVWTQNIVTTTEDLTKTCGNKLSMVNVNCHVQDDLTINGIADEVSISGSGSLDRGAYYGYGSGLTTDAGANSAININAKNVNLTIDGIGKLWLAGQSFISVPLGYGKDPLEPNKVWGIESPPIMQGESVAFKGNQAAYLLPGDCIEGVWHNPMTLDEYNAATQNQTRPLQLSMRKADSINGDIMNLDQYLDVSTEYSRYNPVVVQYALGGKMVYIYMNFSTPNAAKKYFEEYYNTNKDLVDTRMETIGTGKIVINVPEEKITATGNLVVHSDGSGEGGSPNTIINSNTAATNAEVREADYSYTGNFRNLTMTLDADTVYYGSNSNLTESLFRYENLTEIAPLSGSTEVVKGADNFTLYVVDSPSYTINTTNNCGLVIATGDVYVEASFKGLIITKGEVILKKSGVITSAPEAINELIGSDETLRNFFKYYDDPNAGKESKEAIDIYYENWQKN